MTETNSKTITLREAAQMLVDALQSCADNEENPMETREALTAGRAALALPDEPVAWRYKGEATYDGNKWHDNYEVTTSEQVAKFKDKNATPLYATPQSAPLERQPLTSEALFDLALAEVNRESDVVVMACNLIRAAEAAHGIKGAA